MLTIKLTFSASTQVFKIPAVPNEYMEYAHCPYNNCTELVRIFDTRMPREPQKFCSANHRKAFWLKHRE